MTWKTLWLCKLRMPTKVVDIFIVSSIMWSRQVFFFSFPFSPFFLLRNSFGGLLNFYGESRPSPGFFCFSLFCVITNSLKKKRVKNLCSWLRPGRRRILGSINKWPVRWCRRRSARIRPCPRHILTVRCHSHSCRRWPTPPPSRSERYCSLNQHLRLQNVEWEHIVRFIPFFFQKETLFLFFFLSKKK